MLSFVEAGLRRKEQELKVHQAVWNATLRRLENEIIKGRSGIDLSNLLSD